MEKADMEPTVHNLSEDKSNNVVSIDNAAKVSAIKKLITLLGDGDSILQNISIQNNPDITTDVRFKILQLLGWNMTQFQGKVLVALPGTNNMLFSVDTYNAFGSFDGSRLMIPQGWTISMYNEIYDSKIKIPVPNSNGASAYPIAIILSSLEHTCEIQVANITDPYKLPYRITAIASLYALLADETKNYDTKIVEI